jgi:alcohol dehydrogenase class IV
MTPFAFNTTPSIIFEDGAAVDMAKRCGRALGERVLFVTDAGIMKLGLADGAIANLRDAGHTVTIFDAVEADPSRVTLDTTTAAARNVGATGIVGFGGGSSMDVAKLVALLAGSAENLDEAWGVGNAKGPRLPLVLVPTTAGTGSEVTPVSIITVEGETKLGVVSPIILPDIALLDATLTLGLPPAVTAATGIDAMVHAIEAIASASANNNPISQVLGREALVLLGANIETAVKNGANAAARGAMLLGSMLAGQAFANSPVAAVHALAYPIGGRFHIPHGLSNALVLPHVLRFNAANGEAAKIYASLAPLVFPDIDTGESSQAITAAFAERLVALAIDLGLPTRLRDVDIPQDACEGMAEAAMAQQRLLVNNPRKVTQADALAIYRAAW